MNDPTKTNPPEAADARVGAAGLGAGFPQPDQSAGGNDPLPTNAALQGSGGAPKAKEMTLPCLMEMGDIAPALAILLQMQAQYARGEPGTSRAMRDVAYNAVATEIERYIRTARWTR